MCPSSISKHESKTRLSYSPRFFDPKKTNVFLSRMLNIICKLYRIVLSNLLWLFRVASPQATYLHNEQLEQRIVEPSDQRWGWDGLLKVVMKFVWLILTVRKGQCLHDLYNKMKNIARRNLNMADIITAIIYLSKTWTYNMVHGHYFYFSSSHFHDPVVNYTLLRREPFDDGDKPMATVLCLVSNLGDVIQHCGQCHRGSAHGHL